MSTTRFVCISDTHGKINFNNIPDGDVLSKKPNQNCSFRIINKYMIVHAGDLTRRSTMAEYEETINWLSSLPHK